MIAFCVEIFDRAIASKTLSLAGSPSGQTVTFTVFLSTEGTRRFDASRSSVAQVCLRAFEGTRRFRRLERRTLDVLGVQAIGDGTRGKKKLLRWFKARNGITDYSFCDKNDVPPVFAVLKDVY